MKKLITIKGELNEINTTSGMLMAEAKRLDFSLNKYISKVLDDHVKSLTSTKEYIISSSQKYDYKKNIPYMKGLSNKIEYYVYILFNKNEIVYIGNTGNFRARILQHVRSEKIFDEVRFILFKDDYWSANKCEKKFIRSIKPRYNTYLIGAIKNGNI